MAMPQQDNFIEQICRLEANRPLRGFATLEEANTPRAELMAYAEAHGDLEELARLKERLRRLLERV